MNIKELNDLKKAKGITFDTLAKLSDVSISTLKDIFRGKTPNPRIDTIEAIEKALNLENEEDKKIKAIGGFSLPDKSMIPLVGQVVAGKPVESPEYIEGYVYIDYKNPDEYFALKVRGDSMINVGINKNSILIVHKQQCADNGDIIVAAIDGESTVKRFREQNDIVVLMPENSNYSPIIVPKNSNFYIFGKVVEIRNKL